MPTAVSREKQESEENSSSELSTTVCMELTKINGGESQAYTCKQVAK